MVENQDGDAFHLRWRQEPDQDLALAIRTDALEAPVLFAAGAGIVGGQRHALVTDRRDVRAALRFHQKLAGVLAAGHRGHQKRRHRLCSNGQSIPP
jgi:hypothetical protein